MLKYFLLYPARTTSVRCMSVQSVSGVRALLFVSIAVFYAAGVFSHSENALADSQATEILSTEAQQMTESGEMMLIDVRSPEEWRQTGVADVAVTNSMHVPGFLERLQTMTEGDNARLIGLICASGNRSAYLQTELKKHGFSNIVTIMDGMLGSSAGRGWLDNGFPVRNVDSGGN